MQNSLKRSQNLNQAMADASSIRILYVTADLIDSDYLAHSLRRVAPEMHIEPSLPDFKRVDQLLRASTFDVVLLDDRFAASEKLLLIAHLDSQQLTPAVIAIIGAGEKHPAQDLMALSDDYIVRGPNFVNGLVDLLKQVFVRCRLGIRRRNRIPEQSSPEAPPKIEAENSTTAPPQSSELRISPRMQVNIPCRLDWKGDTFTGRIRDLSGDGAFIETHVLPRNGTAIRISFNVDGREIMQEAVVIHEGWYLGTDNNFYGFGVRLGEISEDAKCAYEKIIRASTEPAMSKISLTP
jgi:hypothetical protein